MQISELKLAEIDIVSLDLPCEEASLLCANGAAS